MSKVICIVDDQPALRQMLRFALNFQGVAVIEAVDGADALDKIATHHVDMVIADWQMPVMDGLELVRRLRKMDAYINLPILVVSCRDDLAARQEARALGVMTWLRKPFRVSEVQAVVEHVLDLSGQELLPAAAERIC